MIHILDYQKIKKTNLLNLHNINDIMQIQLSNFKDRDLVNLSSFIFIYDENVDFKYKIIKCRFDISSFNPKSLSHVYDFLKLQYEKSNIKYDFKL